MRVSVLAGAFGLFIGSLRTPTALAAEAELDAKEPPFGEFDYSWLNGSNRQPDSLLKVGPLTGSIYVDTDYAYQFSKPVDHTIFPTTTGVRHDEFNVNLAAIGFDVTGLDGPIGRLYLQMGSNTQSDVGQDQTTKRGHFLTHQAFDGIQQAAAGWHFHALHGINVEFGILPSYVGIESYLPQENWNYTHSFISDATPYYLSGMRVQLYLTQRQKLELWAVNGWQTLGQWHEGKAFAYQYNWRPNGGLYLTHSMYFGREAPTDPRSLREYTDNIVQLKFYTGGKDSAVHSSSISLVGDYGIEHRSNAPSGMMGGVALAHRTEFLQYYALSERADYYKDSTQAVILPLPESTVPTRLPDAGKPFVGRGYTLTFDIVPSPWIIFRLEYAHRQSNVRYFSTHDGVSAPPDSDATDDHPYVPHLATSDDRVVANVTLRL